MSRIIQYVAVSLCCAIFLQSAALAKSRPTPLWLKYMKAGEVTLKQKKTKLSQQYNLGALAELEKMAQKKQRIKPTAKEQKWLRYFPSTIELPFMLAKDYNPLDDIKELMNTRMQFEESKRLLQRDANSNDPGANARIKATAANMQKQAQKMHNVGTRYQSASTKRSYRIYNAYKVVLGDRNPATVYAKKQYLKSR